MRYVKYNPDISLTGFIDFYWVLETGVDYRPFNAPLFADVCTDVFFNIGSTPASFNDKRPLAPGNVYIGGTSTSGSFVRSQPDCIFIGIRFKAGGLSAFFNVPLTDIVDRILELNEPLLASILYPDERLAARLDHYFMAKRGRYQPFSFITELVYRHNGQLPIDKLSYHCNMSNRTLERIFQNHTGIGPKMFTGIVRFQHALNLMQQSRFKLQEVAFKAGYYDPAHFTREIKKYSGLAPSAFHPGPRFP